MKKYFIIILCCLFALSTGKVMAKSNSEKSSPEISLAINLGDVSELDADALVNVVNESSDMGTTEGPPCTLKVTITYPDGKVVVFKAEGSCAEMIALAEKIAENAHLL